MRVFVAGPAAWNQMVYVDALPEPRPHSVRAERHHETVGGTSAGKALNLRSLGVAVTLRTHLGDDEPGRRVEDALREAGVDLLVERSARTERHLNLMAGAARLSIHLDKPGRGSADHEAAVDAALAAAPIACIDLAEESRPLLQRAKAAGCTVVCDVHDYDGHDPYRDDWVAMADVLFANDDSLPDPLPWMRDQVRRGTSLVVVTQGSAGAIAMSADETIHVPVEPVDHVVDTNGAGDAFVAGFLHARLGRAALPVAMAAGHRQAARCLASPDLAPGSSPGLSPGPAADSGSG